MPFPRRFVASNYGIQEVGGLVSLISIKSLRSLRISRGLYFSKLFLPFSYSQKCIRKRNCICKYPKLNSNGNTTDIKSTKNITKQKELDEKILMHICSQEFLIFISRIHYNKKAPPLEISYRYFRRGNCLFSAKKP